MVGERVAAARPQHLCRNVIAASLKTVMQQNTRRIPSYGLERTITRAEFCAGRSNRGSKQAFACECYATLIRLHPEVKPLFTHTSMEKQAKKFMASLTLVLHVLGKPDVLTTTLQRLGRRHQAVGVRVEHYPMLAEALLATFASHLGGQWTADMQAAWTEAFEAMASLMSESYTSSAVLASF